MIIVTVGLPGSGKTTWAKEWQLKSGGIVVERDELRKLFPAADEKLITKLESDIITSAVNRGYHVTIADTNLRLSRVKELIQTHIRNDVQVSIKRFDGLSVKDLIKRKPDMEKVITNMAKQYSLGSKWWKDEELFEFDRIEFDTSLPKAVIVDLDGTLALLRNRGPFEYWKLLNDEPSKPVIAVVNSLKNIGAKVIIVSGRPATYRGDTETWLKVYGVNYDALHMRQEGDNRSDSVIKAEILRELSTSYYPFLSIDDRDKVVAMWRANGVRTLQVDYGDF